LGETPLKRESRIIGTNLPIPSSVWFGGGGVAAKPINASNTPTKQRTNAEQIRGLNIPDRDVDFFGI
jgi:hypothetical protein